MQEKFQCKAALKSPAHITLIAPFRMDPLKEKDLLLFIGEFAAMQSPFLIRLQNFSNFKTEVLFVDVEKNEKLETLKLQLDSFLTLQEKFPIKKEARPFHPHVTIATRDLHKKAFHKARDHFMEKTYTAEWRANSISVLKHNKKNWDVFFTSSFLSE